jgi:hypothetical protein
MKDVSETEIYGHGVPGSTDAEAIDFAAFQALDHIGWRQDDETKVRGGIDSACSHPETQLIAVT